MRIWKRIFPKNYSRYICRESVKGTVSHNDLYEAVRLSTGEHASRYIEKKNNAYIFIQKILEELIR